MRIDLTKMQVAAVVTMLRDEFGEDDERLLLDTLEGETDLFEITRQLLDGIEADEGDKAALAQQMQDRADRKARADARIKARREAVMALMEAARLDKLTLPEATLSLRKVPPKPIVTDEAGLPDEFCKITRKPDMAAIKAGVESGAAVPGVTFDNGGLSLTVRRK